MKDYTIVFIAEEHGMSLPLDQGGGFGTMQWKTRHHVERVKNEKEALKKFRKEEPDTKTSRVVKILKVVEGIHEIGDDTLKD